MIYFVTAREIGRVKIGFSDEPRGRFMQLRTASPVPLALERICEGDLMDEFALHKRFQAWRRSGEWFDLCPEIEAHMAALSLPAFRSGRDPTPPGEKPRTGELAKMVAISKSYASMILAGAQKPSRPLAIYIFRATGWRHPSIEVLTEAQMSALERIEPWAPRPTPDTAPKAA